jgi:hypothetical protein
MRMYPLMTIGEGTAIILGPITLNNEHSFV